MKKYRVTIMPESRIEHGSLYFLVKMELAQKCNIFGVTRHSEDLLLVTDGTQIYATLDAYLPDGTRNLEVEFDADGYYITSEAIMNMRHPRLLMRTSYAPWLYGPAPAPASRYPLKDNFEPFVATNTRRGVRDDWDGGCSVY